MVDNSNPRQPPRRPKDKQRSQMSLALKRAMEDDKELKELKAHNAGLMYFDHQSPAVKKRRETAREHFEVLCEVLLDKEDLTTAEMYNKGTIAQCTSDFLFYYAKGSKAKGAKEGSTEKPKAGVLYQQKEALYWWIIRIIDDFLSVYGQWHLMTNASIQKAAFKMGFETSFRPKNNLTSIELDLFLRHISKKVKTGLENWKQHYGSFLADNETRRSEDETLRWSDIDFFRVEGSGIGFKINFRYVKGARDPHVRKQISATRTFTIFPLNSDDYHFDLALLMTALAYSCGLFADVGSPAELFAGALANLPKVADVDQQAVFLASNQSQALEQRPMNESQLTPKLQEMCNAVGLMERNTMYSLRRTAITESRRTHGTEHAQDIAFRVRGGGSTYSYNDTAFQDFDIANDRHNLEGFSRTEIRQMFSQAATSRVEAGPAPLTDVGDSGTSLTEKLNLESMRCARTDRSNVETEANLRELKNEAIQLLISMGIDEVFLYNDRDLNDHLVDKATDSEECKSKLNDIRELEKANKTTLRRMQAKFKKDIKQELLDDVEATQNVLDRKAKGTLGRQGTLSAPEIEARGIDRSAGEPTDQQRRAISALSTEATEADRPLDERNLNADNLDESADHTHTEPREWEHLADEITIQQHAGADTTPPTLTGRIAFIKAFIGKKDVETSGLACMQCHYDDTVPNGKKAQRYTLADLDKHLKNDYHSRKSQLLRAFEIDKNESGKVKCPVCNEIELNKRNFATHLEEVHDEQMVF